jgi:hypothetical protein
MQPLEPLLMDIKDDTQFAWKHYDALLPGAIAFAVDDYGSVKVFTTCPIYGSHGGGKGRWRPSCMGESVEVTKSSPTLNDEGGGSLVVRKGWEEIAHAQKIAHMEAEAQRMPIPHHSTVKPIPLKQAPKHVSDTQANDAPEVQTDSQPPVTSSSVSQTFSEMEDLRVSTPPAPSITMATTNTAVVNQTYVARMHPDPHDTVFLDCIAREVVAARAKFPGNNRQFAALAEEFGELAQALLDHAYGKGTPEEVYAEAVQVAAMAMRVALGGSGEFPYAYDIKYAEHYTANRFKPKDSHEQK